MIEQLIDYAIKNGGWMEMDRQYLANKIFELVGGDLEADATLSSKQTAEALSKKATDDEAIQYMIFVQLLDLMTPPPSVVNALFSEHHHRSPEEGTKFYHELLDGIGFFETSYAKTPEDFLNFYAEGSLVSMNNRFIRMNLGGQSWGFQLLPNKEVEVGIVFPEYDAQYSTLLKTLTKLFEISEVFPHYQISLGPAWFNTKTKSEMQGKSELHEIYSSELVEALVFKEEKVLQLASYNIDEIIRFAKLVKYQAYRTLSGYREGNKFFLRVEFKNDEMMQESLWKVR